MHASTTAEKLVKICSVVVEIFGERPIFAVSNPAVQLLSLKTGITNPNLS